MKKSILIASFFLGTYAFAQTAEQRAVIQRSIDKVALDDLKVKFENEFELQQSKIAIYLAAHPQAQKTFVRDGNSFMLQRIDAEGYPVYINTKDANQVMVSKSSALYAGGSLGVNITGSGMTAGVWDGGQVNANHELLLGQSVMQAGQSVSTIDGNAHMQAVTGIMVGKILTNSSNPNAAAARGLAPDAKTKNYDWTNDLGEMVTFAGQGFLISNHSYGNSNDYTTPLWQFGAYDSVAKNWDALLKTTPNYLPFVAVGNEQSPTGVYEPNPQDPSDPNTGMHTNGNYLKGGYDLITGSSAAKNVMTVGAIKLDKSMTDYSNWGPADDGRVKPDIVTLGSNIVTPLYDSNNTYAGIDAQASGTSYSSPAASAAGLLLQQYYFSIFGSYMKAASLKALMLHTADDAGNPGPDAKFGWGILNVENAARTIKQMQTGGSAKLIEFTTNPTNNNSAELNSSGVFGGGKARVSISWTDDDGVAQTSADGINNTASRLVYSFDVLFRNFTAAADTRTYAPLSVANPNTQAVLSTNWFVNNVDNYKQANYNNTALNDNFIVYVRKNTTSPAAVKPFSLLITGIKATNSSLATTEQVKDFKTLFYSKEDGRLKMISNNMKTGFGAFKIYDMSGKLLKSGTEKGNEIIFSNDTNGTYILVYQNQGKEETFKFKK